MDLTRVIVGPVVTEKAERQKMERTFTLKVAPSATKVDIQKALKRHYDVDASSVRIQRVGSKVRMVGVQAMVKRKPYKRALVTLSKDSKTFDLAQFKTA